MHRILYLFFSLIAFSCTKNLTKVKPGRILNESVTVDSNVYVLDLPNDSSGAALIIEGENITIDFSNSTIQSSLPADEPNNFKGIGILVRNGKNITLKNLKIRGYKIAIQVDHVKGFQLLDSDLSYNYRQKLGSYREREDFADWLSYHNNENHEWKRYGMALYLNESDSALVKGLKVTGGQNGIMIHKSNYGNFYNNEITFNSGIGIGLYRSSFHKIMHNRLDFNVRGYSHGYYSRGQDSAGILCYEQSSQNTFAYNSATHSGDGFFLWAGQQTMDSGEGGCNDNIIYKNDFSYAPTNGIEVTFSRNTILENILNGCRYGIWGGYSFNTLIQSNQIHSNDFGIAIEHGQNNAILANDFANNKIAVKLWDRDNQPEDWAFAKNKDVSSQNNKIFANSFQSDSLIFELSGTTKTQIGGDNFRENFKKLILENKPNRGLQMEASGIISDFTAPTPLSDGMDPFLSPKERFGRENITIDEWGPFDFKSPKAILRTIENDKYVFLIDGPVGNWKLTGAEGFEKTNVKTGTIPSTFTAYKIENSENFYLQFEYIGEGGMDRFGRPIQKGEVFPFEYRDLNVPAEWKVQWKNKEDSSDQWTSEKIFPLLSFAWWGSPTEKINPDHFLTKAYTQLNIKEGNYKILVTSDDGVRIKVDGVTVLNQWKIREPEREELFVKLKSNSVIEVEHFEETGFSALDLRIQKIP